MAPRLRTYPGAQGKVNACGGGRKTKHEWYRGRQTSNEAGKPHREVGKPLACSHGEMSRLDTEKPERADKSAVGTINRPLRPVDGPGGWPDWFVKSQKSSPNLLRHS